MKPANIKVRDDGTVKVLDFGLAKALDPAAATSSEAANSPTLSMHATAAGVILGTAAYMPPEQASGKVVDKRADIWSFGCVLFEMLTGRRAFQGDDATDTIVAVVSKEPDWTALPPAAAGVRPLLARCLRKERKQRLQAIGDARVQIEDLISGNSDQTTASRAPSAMSARRGGLAAIAALFGVAGIATLVTWSLTRPTQPAPLLPARLEVMLSQPLALYGADRDIAISRDGRYIAYRAGAGVSQLVVRAIDRLDAQPLAGITSARQPFFSPDGRWIGYFDGSTLKKVATAGGPPITVLTIRGVPRGASWGDDDQIVFATTETNRGLQRVSANGGNPTVLTAPDTANGETNHWYPSVLPGGRGVLFSLATPNLADRTQVAVLDLETGRRKTLIRGSQAEYVGNGYLLIASAGALHAVRFDLEQLEVLSNPEPVVDDVWMAGGAANYAVSRAGTLVYIAARALRPRSLVWVDRNGRETTIPAPPRAYFEPRLSPDGTRVALSIRDQENDIWIWDFTRPERALSRLTFDTDLDQRPVWTADGSRIVFSSQRGSAFNLYVQNADGSGTVERLTNSPYAQAPAFVAPDGTGVLGSEQPPATGGDIVWFPLRSPTGGAGAVAPDSQSAAEPLVRTPAIEYNPALSPNGRYLAYQSNESGPNEIYVRPYPQVSNGRWQVSTRGGTRPVWARSGRELFYLDLSNTLTAVPVETSGSTFTYENPAKVFDRIYAVPLDNSRPFDVAPDGRRFLMIKENSEDGLNATRQGLVVVLNWFEELKTKLATK